ncbi:type II toxin-antitoxin system prevent-host-death family antitoxin [Rhizobium sp. NPDC090279]|uniref:type II toxin-antitoxin system prevent-host-death family antitoxin n=1 Tax=Rhizobium sp. NPDC090279 TaxID=3364499 RepID=UPI00383AD5D4
MTMISSKDAKASFSHVVDPAAAGEFVMTTRHGRAAAVVVSARVAGAGCALALWFG